MSWERLLLLLLLYVAAFTITVMIIEYNNNKNNNIKASVCYITRKKMFVPRFIYFFNAGWNRQARAPADRPTDREREQPPTTRTTLKTVARTVGRMQPDLLFYLQTYTFINYPNRRSFMSKLTIMTCCGIILEMMPSTSLRSRKNAKRSCTISPPPPQPPIGNRTPAGWFFTSG